MRTLCYRLIVVFALAALLGSGGCAMLDFMSPANTWKLNRGPALDEGDAYFSVSDPAATTVDAP